MKCTINRLRTQEKLAFNKKNATWFADQIYSETKDEIQFTKLCCDALAGQRKLHCAIGEAYACFVKPNLRAILKYDKSLSSAETRYVSKWSGAGDGSTGAAIDALVEQAELKKDTDEARSDLATALNYCVSANDNDHDYSDSVMVEYLSRAKKVADTWRDEVLPLLK